MTTKEINKKSIALEDIIINPPDTTIMRGFLGEDRYHSKIKLVDEDKYFNNIKKNALRKRINIAEYYLGCQKDAYSSKDISFVLTQILHDFIDTGALTNIDGNTIFINADIKNKLLVTFHKNKRVTVNKKDGLSHFGTGHMTILNFEDDLSIPIAGMLMSRFGGTYNLSQPILNTKMIRSINPILSIIQLLNLSTATSKK